MQTVLPSRPCLTEQIRFACFLHGKKAGSGRVGNERWLDVNICCYCCLPAAGYGRLPPGTGATLACLESRKGQAGSV